MFSDWEQTSRRSSKPECPSGCGGDMVELVDVVLDSSSWNVGTSPVWHCGTCSKMFSARSSKTEQIVTRNISSNNMATFSNNPVSRDNLHNEVNNTNLTHYSTLQQDVERLVRKISEETRLKIHDEVQYAFKQQIEQMRHIEGDPLHEIRKRVAIFSLK